MNRPAGTWVFLGDVEPTIASWAGMNRRVKG
jgi:hypothetical protein